MDTVYKLVNQDMTTYGGYRWTMGQAHKPKGRGAALCGPGVLHAYDDPLVGLFRNPADANIPNPRILVCEADGERLTDGLKCGYRGTMTPVRELTVPTITTELRVRFAIGCGLAVRHLWKSTAWVTWANAWLDGSNRAVADAADAADAARAAARAADAAADAADAADAARAAARAADAAARAAAYAARAARAAAYAAAAAARAGAYLPRIAVWALGTETRLGGGA